MAGQSLSNKENAMSPSVVELRPQDLSERGSVCCPHPKAGMKLWNSHPKVYLDLAHASQARCPYCGTLYRLAAAPTQPTA